VNRRPAAFAFAPVLLFLAACAAAPVDMSEPRRVVGTESAVRVDAEIRTEVVNPGAPVPFTYAITNQREETIAIAEVLPETTYDAETQIITVNIGSEVPGEHLLPRLITIAPGEKKTFTSSARMAFVLQNTGNPRVRYPASLRIKVNFLGDTKPFAELLDIPQKAVADTKRADELFPVWLEQNEVVYTNAIPMRWAANDIPPPSPAPIPTRRGGRRP